MLYLDLNTPLQNILIKNGLNFLFGKSLDMDLGNVVVKHHKPSLKITFQQQNLCF